jgi:ketosteroid isomerase-like protein
MGPDEGDVAFTMCRDSLSLTPRAGGEAEELAGHRITIYRKQPDGRWLLARDARTLQPCAGNQIERHGEGRDRVE